MPVPIGLTFEGCTMSLHRLTSLANPMRILVVDDNADCADTLAMHLELDGHSTQKAYDGVEALQLALEFLPQVALIDISLPRMDGNEVAQHLRAQPWGRQMRLIAITGWTSPGPLERARSAFDFRLLKPFSYAALSELLLPSVPSVPSVPSAPSGASFG